MLGIENIYERKKDFSREKYHTKKQTGLFFLFLNGNWRNQSGGQTSHCSNEVPITKPAPGPANVPTETSGYAEPLQAEQFEGKEEMKETR